MLDLSTTATLILVAAGISAVVTGSNIGYPIRFVWCRLLPRPTWGMVRCPYCNAWWGGVLAAAVHSPDPSQWLSWLQVAFSACGVMRVVQAALGGDGIAMVEDFESVFSPPEKSGGDSGDSDTGSPGGR